MASGVVKTDPYYGVSEKTRERLNKRIAIGFPGEPTNVAKGSLFWLWERSNTSLGERLKHRPFYPQDRHGLDG